MFAKNTLASAVAAAIGVSAVGVAQADTIFFPYVALSPTVTTIVSVVNTTDNNWNSNGSDRGTDHLHYRFHSKSVANGEDLLANCEEYNEYLPTSPNDVQTIDLGGVFGSDTGSVLFNDPSINNKWQQANANYGIGAIYAPARGYLVVDNSNAVSPYSTATELAAEVADGPSLFGEAFVFEFGSGAAWGYQARETQATRDSAGNINYSDFRAEASRSPSNVAFMPFAEISTAFFVTPVDFNMSTENNNYRARIDIRSTGSNDIFDRDEKNISGTMPVDVVCVGRVDISDLMSDGVFARVQDGGWGRIWNYRLVQRADTLAWVPANFAVGGTGGLAPAASASSADAGAVLIKLEYNTGGTFNEEAVGGTYNNAIMLHP